jgi:nicotinate-nucleotide pyrophosphorylase (carboxylating)
MELTGEALDAVVRAALAEDVGEGDRTTNSVVPAGLRCRAELVLEEAGVVSGVPAARAVLSALDPSVHVEALFEEGSRVTQTPARLAEIEGLARALLTGERTALNLVGRLCGIATLTARYVDLAQGTGATILDTRKTTPGLRTLEKAAVAAGGATNHRVGLFDAILIKENHATLAGGVGEAVRQARAHAPGLQLEVECRTLAEVDEALAAGAGFLLLDNMSVDELRAAVDRVAGRAQLEASGGFTLETIRAVAGTGVNFISVGAITHSAPALDLSLLLEPIP